MSQPRIRIGFIGLNPNSHWASTAHIPALKSLEADFEVVGVADSTPESGQRTAKTLGLTHAFATPQDLVKSDEVDLVVITVKVPYHFELVSAALGAGKHVHCEWPLSNGLEEATRLASLARSNGVVATVGTQMRAAPEIAFLKGLISDGFVGEVLSTTLIGDGGQWGAETESELAYLYDKSNGASMLTIPFAHTLAGVRDVLGSFDELSGRLITRRKTVRVSETGEDIPRTADDQVMVHGVLESGAAFCAHYRGGLSRGTNLLWEINGTAGDIQVTGNLGHGQFAEMTIRGATGDDEDLKVLTPPPELYRGLPEGVIARNVAGIYALVAQDIKTGTRLAPSFDDALELHWILEKIVESSKRK